MHSKNFYESGYIADQPSFDERPLLSNLLPQEPAFPLTRRAALTVVLALSLGLWAVIWAAVASLAWAALG
jgi:hypothetical protein